MRRVAIFAHYDPKNTIGRYIVHHLAALREVCDEVHFASTSQLTDEELVKVRGIVASHHLYENSGYDFGMWAQVLRTLALREWDELVLTNSSVFGPVGSLAEAFERMRGNKCDFWGMSDSLAFDYHLQSFFLVFRSAILHSKRLEQFFANILPYRNKWQVIRSYEIGLTQFLLDQGFTVAALASVRDPRLRVGSYNPSIRAPIALMKLGVPYVKVALLRDNPADIRLAPVRAAMVARGYATDLTEIDQPPREWIFSGLINGCHLLYQRLRFFLSRSSSTKSGSAPTNDVSEQSTSTDPEKIG